MIANPSADYTNQKMVSSRPPGQVKFYFLHFQTSKGKCEVCMECKTHSGGRDRSYFFCTFPHCVCHSLHARVMLARANAKNSVIFAG